MLDRQGFRPNVGIILLNQHKQVFWGKRIRTHSWQFPQGGIDRGESPEVAMFRELQEEVGLLPQHVCILGRTRDWLHYEVPDQYIRRESRGFYRGQKQIWFLLQLTGNDSDLNLRASDHPEFDAWRWNDYWIPLDAVVEFKRGVYEAALLELEKYLPAQRHYGGQRKTFNTHYRPSRTSSFNRPRQPVRDGVRSMLLQNITIDLPPGASFDPDPHHPVVRIAEDNHHHCPSTPENNPPTEYLSSTHPTENEA